jgi:hypothetical protein
MCPHMADEFPSSFLSPLIGLGRSWKSREPARYWPRVASAGSPWKSMDIDGVFMTFSGLVSLQGRCRQLSSESASRTRRWTLYPSSCLEEALAPVGHQVHVELDAISRRY